MCCPYADAAAFRRREAAFGAAARADGMRVVHAGADGVPDPEQLLAALATATEAALADGRRGLAVSADATALVRVPQHRQAWARVEFLLDRYAADHPVAVLCGYRLDLGEELLAEFAALHAGGPRSATAVRVFGCADGALGLAGRFDPAGLATLGRVLGRLGPVGDDGALVVDLARVVDVDHRVLLALAGHAAAAGRVLSLRAAPPLATRLLELLPASRGGPARVGVRT
ncbi:MEDS domain-containing protein [Geodermatophilus sp. SYSU D00691]